MPQYAQIIDGVRLPVRLGGHAALDFCNTCAGWDGPLPGDYLKSYDHLAVFASYTGLLDRRRVTTLRRAARERPGEAERVLQRARRFRSGVYPLFTGGAEGREWDVVAREAKRASGALELRRDRDGVRLGVGDAPGLAAPLAAIAWASVELLTSDDLQHVGACPGPDCGWLFLDRRDRRRWCSMDSCGNRAKAQRFAARQRRSR